MVHLRPRQFADVAQFHCAEDGNRHSGRHLQRHALPNIGPAFDSVPFDPKQVAVTEVGTASLAFSNGNAGVFSWSIDGIPGSKCHYAANLPDAGNDLSVGVTSLMCRTMGYCAAGFETMSSSER